jgi:hypothetical protein
MKGRPLNSERLADDIGYVGTVYELPAKNAGLGFTSKLKKTAEILVNAIAKYRYSKRVNTQEM